ncbi:dTDP-4-dehydrorhamnose 3,5-epimerase [Rhizobium sp. ARZ01]|uniref:dTDP-4-dehydrorhamnose 3,5-epimerase n=1 Tax=Rhizobium sp. ARZ01 TaxID=2769313 RepID=UPI00177F4C92|nr:dTDP-4-dehydrorhamnose 3,5-epimerase [Rhizobium sp. ARZ01]MBD9374386.1 dTDP-4-dehydrorhamnose 3,5-epimerase [Rhizobium sp. ARZ01]
MSLEIRSLELEEVLEIRPVRIGDNRGFFSETWNAQRFSDAGLNLHFVQDNHSYSAARGVLRGLHYQLPPYAQDKLVRVVRGAIFDVAVDIRPDSPTFGKWCAARISAADWNQLLVPKGFAHGFLTLEPETEVIYKVTNHYSPSHDRAIRFDDADIGIVWPIHHSQLELSEKDRNAPPLALAEVFTPSREAGR